MFRYIIVLFLSLLSLLFLSSCSKTPPASSSPTTSATDPADAPVYTGGRPPTPPPEPDGALVKAEEWIKSLAPSGLLAGGATATGGSSPAVGAHSKWGALIGLLILGLGYAGLRSGRGWAKWPGIIGLVLGTGLMMWSVGTSGLHFHLLPWACPGQLVGLGLFVAWVILWILPTQWGDNIPVYVSIAGVFLGLLLPLTPSWWVLATLATIGWRLVQTRGASKGLPFQILIALLILYALLVFA